MPRDEPALWGQHRGELVCRACGIVYLVAGPSLKCDKCGAVLELVKGEELAAFFRPPQG